MRRYGVVGGIVACENSGGKRACAPMGTVPMRQARPRGPVLLKRCREPQSVMSRRQIAARHAYVRQKPRSCLTPGEGRQSTEAGYKTAGGNGMQRARWPDRFNNQGSPRHVRKAALLKSRAAVTAEECDRIITWLNHAEVAASRTDRMAFYEYATMFHAAKTSKQPPCGACHGSLTTRRAA